MGALITPSTIHKRFRVQIIRIDEAREKRKQIAETYREELAGIKGIHCLNDLPDTKHAYSYFPILVEEQEFGMSRDELYEKLKENNIFSRRYFYPLISNFPTYRGLTSANKDNLPVANDIAEKVLCLPIYSSLSHKHVSEVINILKASTK